jgi:hypothetical protein
MSNDEHSEQASFERSKKEADIRRLLLALGQETSGDSAPAATSDKQTASSSGSTGEYPHFFCIIVSSRRLLESSSESSTPDPTVESIRPIVEAVIGILFAWFRVLYGDVDSEPHGGFKMRTSVRDYLAKTDVKSTSEKLIDCLEPHAPTFLRSVYDNKDPPWHLLRDAWNVLSMGVYAKRTIPNNTDTDQRDGGYGGESSRGYHLGSKRQSGLHARNGQHVWESRRLPNSVPTQHVYDGPCGTRRRKFIMKIILTVDCLTRPSTASEPLHKDDVDFEVGGKQLTLDQIAGFNFVCEFFVLISCAFTDWDRLPLSLRSLIDENELVYSRFGRKFDSAAGCVVAGDPPRIVPLARSTGVEGAYDPKTWYETTGRAGGEWQMKKGARMTRRYWTGLFNEGEIRCVRLSKANASDRYVRVSIGGIRVPLPEGTRLGWGHLQLHLDNHNRVWLSFLSFGPEPGQDQHIVLTYFPQEFRDKLTTHLLRYRPDINIRYTTTSRVLNNLLNGSLPRNVRSGGNTGRMVVAHFVRDDTGGTSMIVSPRLTDGVSYAHWFFRGDAPRVLITHQATGAQCLVHKLDRTDMEQVTQLMMDAGLDKADFQDLPPRMDHRMLDLDFVHPGEHHPSQHDRETEHSSIWDLLEGRRAGALGSKTKRNFQLIMNKDTGKLSTSLDLQYTSLYVFQLAFTAQGHKQLHAVSIATGHYTIVPHSNFPRNTPGILGTAIDEFITAYNIPITPPPPEYLFVPYNDAAIERARARGMEYLRPKQRLDLRLAHMVHLPEYNYGIPPPNSVVDNEPESSDDPGSDAPDEEPAVPGPSKERVYLTRSHTASARKDSNMPSLPGAIVDDSDEPSALAAPGPTRDEKGKGRAQAPFIADDSEPDGPEPDEPDTGDEEIALLTEALGEATTTLDEQAALLADANDKASRTGQQGSGELLPAGSLVQSSSSSRRQRDQDVSSSSRQHPSADLRAQSDDLRQEDVETAALCPEQRLVPEPVRSFHNLNNRFVTDISASV